MCQKCQTPEQRAARTNFLAALPRVRILTYNDLVAANVGPFSASGFSQTIRDYILNMVPKVPVSYVPVVCATCNKPKDARSVELDHIIPVRSFVRYKLVQAHAGLQSPLSTAALSLVADNAYIDQANLIFICKSCNKDKSNQMPTSAMTRHGNRTVLQRLRANLPADRHADIDQLDQMMAQIGLTSALGEYLRGELRVKKTYARERQRPGRYRDEPYPTRRVATSTAPPPAPRLSFVNNVTGVEHGATIQQVVGLPTDVVQAIEDEVIRMFGGSRANIHELMGHGAFQALLRRQTKAQNAAKDLRVCLYCLGMFHKQAFQIEHLDPVDRDPATGSQVPADVYNNNLLGICGSCNGSRNKKTLTRDLLTTLRKARVAAALPGLESICTDMETEALKHIHRLLRL